MIEKATAFWVGDVPYKTLEDAKFHALLGLLSEFISDNDQRHATADGIIKSAAGFVDVLTMTATSRPKARAINGAKRKRAKAKPEPQEAAHV